MTADEVKADFYQHGSRVTRLPTVRSLSSSMTVLKLNYGKIYKIAGKFSLKPNAERIQ